MLLDRRLADAHEGDEAGRCGGRRVIIVRLIGLYALATVAFVWSFIANQKDAIVLAHLDSFAVANDRARKWRLDRDAKEGER